MRYITPLIIVLLFVSCKGSQCLENNIKEGVSIDGEYHLVTTNGLVMSKPYFQIVRNGYFYYQAGIGASSPIKGTITKLADNSYLFNSEYQNSKLNYEKHHAKINDDSVAIDLRLFSGVELLLSDWSFILTSGAVVPLVDLVGKSKSICLPLVLANQIAFIYNKNVGSWKLNDNYLVFEGGCRYNILLMDDDYYLVMKNEIIRIINDTLIWQMGLIDGTIEATFIKQ